MFLKVKYANGIERNIPLFCNKIGMCEFAKCSEFVQITIPEGITEIGPFAFSDCENLTSVVIPSSVTKIDVFAFSMNSKLSNVVFNGLNKVTNINTIFDGCDSLTEVKNHNNESYRIIDGLLYPISKSKISKSLEIMMDAYDNYDKDTSCIVIVTE